MRGGKGKGFIVASGKDVVRKGSGSLQGQHREGVATD